MKQEKIWKIKGRLFTGASGDNKLLQTHVNIQVFLEDWKLEREKRNEENAVTDWDISPYIF